MNSASGTIVVALGGNAISRDGQEGNVVQQFANTRRTASRLVTLIQQGYRLIVTHGNGPQVGNVLRRVELAAHELYTLPLDVCGAHTQGGMGYMIAQCLNNELTARGIARRAVAVVTSVEVDASDPEFQRPTKPIGRYYEAARAAELQSKHRWRMVEIAPGRYRRVVPSPRPREIIEGELLARLVRDGELLVAAGGGGVPVTRGADGECQGVEAVIDKDRTAALLARRVGADVLLIATNVPQVMLDFGTPAQRPIERMTTAEARRWLAEGQFSAGSMGPKIEAAVEFVGGDASKRARAVICDLDEITAGLAGRSGTQIVAE